MRKKCLCLEKWKKQFCSKKIEKHSKNREKTNKEINKFVNSKIPKYWVMYNKTENNILKHSFLLIHFSIVIFCFRDDDINTPESYYYQPIPIF